MPSDIAATIEAALATVKDRAGELPIDATIRGESAIEKDPARARLSPISLAFIDGALAPDGKAEAFSDADLMVVRLLGEGGMGAVYLARQRALGREVAVKVARRAASPNDLNAALVAEAMIMGSLEHPNIVPVHALGCDADGRPVLVMKRVEGVVWRELLDNPSHAAWSREDLADEDRLTTHLQLLIQVANALEYAHHRGAVHRDVKPENVMVGAFGEVYLMDWGIALQRGRPRDGFQLVGTPAFMAPEMVTGSAGDIDAQTDVYLLGSTLHYIVTGRYRHEAEEVSGSLSLALESRPFDYGADVPPELAALCNAATSRAKADRPASAAAFRNEVSAYLRHRSSIAVANSAQAKLNALANDDLLDRAQRLAECRFGFLEALRAWSGNEAARRGLDACLALMVEREIDQRNASAARALLREMSTRGAALVERVDTLEREVEAARERDEQSKRAARELDASISWAPRVILLAIFLVGVVAATVLTTVKEIQTGVAAPITDALTADLTQLVAVIVGVASTAKWLLATQYNRRVIGVLFTGSLTVTLIDAAAWSQHIGSRPANLIDSIAMAAIFTVASQSIEPGWWRIVLVWIISGTLSVAVPTLSTPAASLATVITVIVGIQVARRSAARARAMN